MNVHLRESTDSRKSYASPGSTSISGLVHSRSPCILHIRRRGNFSCTSIEDVGIIRINCQCSHAERNAIIGERFPRLSVVSRAPDTATGSTDVHDTWLSGMVHDGSCSTTNIVGTNQPPLRLRCKDCCCTFRRASRSACSRARS